METTLSNGYSCDRISGKVCGHSGILALIIEQTDLEGMNSKAKQAIQDAGLTIESKMITLDYSHWTACMLDM